MSTTASLFTVLPVSGALPFTARDAVLLVIKHLAEALFALDLNLIGTSHEGAIPPMEQSQAAADHAQPYASRKCAVYRFIYFLFTKYQHCHSLALRLGADQAEAVVTVHGNDIVRAIIQSFSRSSGT